MANFQQKNTLLFICSYPPRQCGIATFSYDLVHALKDKFDEPFDIKICSLEEEDAVDRQYPAEVIYSLISGNEDDYKRLADQINANPEIMAVCVQHEYGLFGGEYGTYLLGLLENLKKPVAITLHSILPNPNSTFKKITVDLCSYSSNIIVMTKRSKEILVRDYDIPEHKISIIIHGTHAIVLRDKKEVKQSLKLEDKFVFSTFGLLSRDKDIETALRAMPAIIKNFPNALYLVLGRTHPVVLKKEGEIYRQSLEKLVAELGIGNNVVFVDRYLDVEEILQYLQATDVYLFTSLNPNQSVSGTLSYAMAAGCPIISTPIAHAKEFLGANCGFIIDFKDSRALAEAAIKLLSEEELRNMMEWNLLHQMRNSSWDNVAIAYGDIFRKYFKKLNFAYKLPEIEAAHLRRLTDQNGIVQFAKFNMPIKESGYTLDDNARALIVAVNYYEHNKDVENLKLIDTYLNFIEKCQQRDGRFLNYINKDLEPSQENLFTNLEDANGRAIWSLGYLINSKQIPSKYRNKAKKILYKSLNRLNNLTSPRAMAFSIKGLYYFYNQTKLKKVSEIIDVFARRIVRNYQKSSDRSWNWFEPCMTYANGVLPESLLMAFLVVKNLKYKEVAKGTFDYLISQVFINDKIKVISNKGWFKKGGVRNDFGEQPIDVAYMISALDLFFKVFKDKKYAVNLGKAFSWFLGNNQLRQVVYNEATGGCFDGLEEKSINLNQGAESTVCYLLARMVTEEFFITNKNKFDKSIVSA